MSVGPPDLLTWAQSVGPSDGEVAFRAAVSRAYYAAYHACRIWHARLPVPGSSHSHGGRHDELLSQLQHPASACSAPQAAKSRQLAAALRDLRSVRVDSDYELGAGVGFVTVQEACSKAKIILTAAT
jgi:hypothetical protein